MSSQATPQLLEERRRAAVEEYPTLIEDMRERYVEIIKANNEGNEPTPKDLKKIEREIEQMIRNSIGVG